jgi:hypothetical protein
METVEQRLNTRAYRYRQVTVYRSRRRDNPKYLNLQQHHCRNPIPHDICPIKHTAIQCSIIDFYNPQGVSLLCGTESHQL